jgi:TatD DNase family protein
MIDSHCHIDLYKDPLAVAREAESRKIHTVAVTHLPSHYQQAKMHLAKFNFVRPALGLHPLVSDKHSAEFEMFRAFSKEAKYIGEIGLDFSSAGRPTRIQQEQSFDFALDCIGSTRKFVTLHSRGAEDEVLARLQSHSTNKVVFHYFSGNRNQLLRLLDNGHFVSINTAMMRTSKWQTLVQSLPLSRILTETDGPFVKHGTQPSKPQDVIEVCRWLGGKFSQKIEDIVDQIKCNFYSLSGCADDYKPGKSTL